MNDMKYDNIDNHSWFAIFAYIPTMHHIKLGNEDNLQQCLSSMPGLTEENTID